MEIDFATGEYLVNLARKAAESWVVRNERISPIEPIPEQAKLKTGAFVTVKKYRTTGEKLRGCIGYIEGIAPLYVEIIDLARASTLEDPRFPPVRPEELDNLIFEVTVLTIPEKIIYSNPSDLVSQIKVGRDGLIVEKGYNRGLLLPQVPVEQHWNVEEFLSYTCRKAYLPIDIWKKEEIIIKRFQGIIFSEKMPGGEIEREEIK
ncbi:MAG: TIGR00296 family protein [Candidatus Heimdallarchaeaceae archaeon]